MGVAHTVTKGYMLPSYYDVYQYVTEFDSEYQPLIHDYTWSLPFGACSLYLLFVAFGPSLVKKKFDLSKVLRRWNLFLFILSLVMFWGMAPPVASFFLDRGMYQLIYLPGRELYH